MIVEPIDLARISDGSYMKRKVAKLDSRDKRAKQRKGRKVRKASYVDDVLGVWEMTNRGLAKAVTWVPRPLWDAAATAAGAYFDHPEEGYLAGELVRKVANEIEGREEPVQTAKMDNAIGRVVDKRKREAFRGYYDDFRRHLIENVPPRGVPRYWHNTHNEERLGPRIGPNARTPIAGMDWEEPPRWPTPVPMSEGYVSSGRSRPMSARSESGWSEPYSRMDYTERSFGSKPMSFVPGRLSPRGQKRKKRLAKQAGRKAKVRAWSDIIPAFVM